MKRILFVHHSVGWGGAPNSLIKLINNLDYSNYLCEVLLIKDSRLSEILKSFNISYRIAGSSFYKNFYKYYVHSDTSSLSWYNVPAIVRYVLSWLLSRYFFASRELARNHYDIIHLNSLALTDWLAPAKKHGKVIIHVRETFKNVPNDILAGFFIGQLRRYSDKIIAISKDCANRINIPEKTEVIYNYSEIASNNNIVEESYGSKKILYVGGDAIIKGYLTITDALPFINKDISLIFAGNYSSKLQEKRSIFNIKKRKLLAAAKSKIEQSDNVIIVGMLSDINGLLSEVCCLVSPFSIAHFSRPVIEAFASRKPVIVTDISGIDELVEDGINGIIVPNNDPHKLADAINKICNNPLMAKNLGNAGFEKAKKLFSPKNIRHIVEVYENI
jgi:glycosyltransferase involved in cell wall biosynthesis